MTIYQKAIKLRKMCESRKTCSGCIYNSKLTLNINEEVLKLYTKAEVLILVSDYLDNRQLPFTTTRINYDLLIEPITTSTYNVTLF